VKVWPATVRVPVLVALPVLADTEKPVVPFPFPLLPELRVIQPALLEAVQEQPVGAVMLTVPVPPAEIKAWLEGEVE